MAEKAARAMYLQVYRKTKQYIEGLSSDDQVTRALKSYLAYNFHYAYPKHPQYKQALDKQMKELSEKQIIMYYTVLSRIKPFYEKAYREEEENPSTGPTYYAGNSNSTPIKFDMFNS